MKELNYRIKILEKAKNFVQDMDERMRAKIAAAIQTMSEGDFLSVDVKSLRGPMKELRVASYRIVFFAWNGTLWFVSGFRKKTQKTPSYEIEHAQKILKMLDDERKKEVKK